MKILAIETCFGKFSVALFFGDKEISFFESTEENKQAENLIPAIEKILAENKIWYSDLNYIAAPIGPGSFTGLRIGLATAKGIALATKIKTIAVTTLEAAAEKSGWPVYLNAHRGEAYLQQDETAAPELISYTGNFNALPTAHEVAKSAIKKSLSPLTLALTPLYIRKPDAKLPQKII